MRFSLPLWGVAPLFLVFVSGCNFREDKVSSLNEPQDRSNWYAWLDSNVIQPKCIRCHAGGAASAGVDLSSYARTMATGSVVAGRVDKSAFFLSVQSGRMPKEGSPVNAEQLQFIQEWIEKGALEKAGPVVVPPPPPADPEPSPTWAYIGKYIIERRCVGCHQPPKPKAGILLTDLKAILDEGLVVPKDPDGSPLLQQIEEGMMPPKPPELTDAQKKSVRDWIESGAKEREGAALMSAEAPPSAPIDTNEVPEL